MYLYTSDKINHSAMDRPSNCINGGGRGRGRGRGRWPDDQIMKQINHSLHIDKGTCRQPEPNYWYRVSAWRSPRHHGTARAWTNWITTAKVETANMFSIWSLSLASMENYKCSLTGEAGINILEFHNICNMYTKSSQYFRYLFWKIWKIFCVQCWIEVCQYWISNKYL